MSVSRYEITREKSKRPQLSCNSCRARKVKCDRLQPCSACSLHQISEQCQYDLTESDRKPILQAEALRAKDREIAWLKEQIEHLGGSPLGSDTFYDRKKRKVAANIGHRGGRSSSQRSSPSCMDQLHGPTRYNAADQNNSVKRPFKRSKSAIKYISIPSPGNSSTIIARGPLSSPPHWNENDVNTQWAPMLKRTFTSPTYHIYDGNKLGSTETAAPIKQEHPAAVPAAACENGEQIVLAHHSRLWSGCFSSGPDSLALMPTCDSTSNAVNFLPYSSPNRDGVASAKSSPGHSHSTPMPPANCHYSTTVPTPSSASCPSSAYAHSASGSSSLHTPSASHPVSPTLSQNQSYCMSHPQSLPPSPMWALDAAHNSGHATAAYDSSGNGDAINHAYINNADNANSAALIAELAGAESKASMGPWQWKMAWAS